MRLEVLLAPDPGPFRGLGPGSLSHTDGLAAFVAGEGVGVDVERVRPVRRMENLAARFGIELPEGDDPERLQAFFAGWVRAEARGKALGLGLQAPAPAREAVWSAPLDGLPEGYAGAVARLAGPCPVALAAARGPRTRC